MTKHFARSSRVWRWVSFAWPVLVLGLWCAVCLGLCLWGAAHAMDNPAAWALREVR